MIRFRYKAATPTGGIRRGELEALNAADLEARLARMELTLIRHRRREERAGWWPRKIRRRSLMLFCLHMEKLVAAGVPIPEALDEARECGLEPRLREAIMAMREDVAAGSSLSQALAAHAESFPAAFPGLIRVGERSGRLAEILGGLAANLKWEETLAERTRVALRYPLFVAVVVTGLFFFLMLYLTPQLVRFLPVMGGELPFHTRMLMALSEGVSRWWPWMIALPVAGWLALDRAARMASGVALWRDRLWLSLPHFGPLARRLHLVRFAVHFALMYRSGVPVLEAMEILEGVSGNREFARQVRHAGRRVADTGASLSEALREADLFPPPLPRLMLVGEKAGRLDQAMLDAADLLDREARAAIEGLQSLIEPVLTVFLGGMLGWVILSVLGPIYETISHVRF
ncbi:MAG: type II secretion system F family protein [Magnetococcales bacterium]|nr:type II secretion system F family protein [Magnetococcales bacterium]